MAAGLAGVLCASGVCAAGLDPTNAPGPTMHSLEEIYQELMANRERIQQLEQRMATDGMGHTVAGMALIPAGPFLMGDCFGRPSSSELPVHTVTVSAVYMDVYEVRSNLWREVYDWAVAHNYHFSHAGSAQQPSHPVHSVSWHDCVKWANARSEMEGLTPCYYTGASKTTVYRTENVDVQNGWVRWDANGYGLFDMAGNVSEWCWDWRVYNYYTTSPGTDPRGPESGTDRVVRGGSWTGKAQSCRVANRGYQQPHVVTSTTGLRLVRAAP